MKPLLVTTDADLSLPYFKQIGAEVVYYGQYTQQLNKLLDSQVANKIYLRDPFNTEVYDTQKITEVVNLIEGRFPGAVYIDQAKTYDDLLFEDKWSQYTIFEDLMPVTRKLTASGQFIEGIHIAKKRISSRSRGISLRLSEIDARQKYIIQEKLRIEREFRVFAVKGQVIETVGVRSSKTEDSKVKYLAIEPISKKLKEMAEEVMARIPQVDFAGLDMAQTQNKTVLLEVNRSPQFKRFNELTGGNILVEHPIF